MSSHDKAHGAPQQPTFRCGSLAWATVLDEQGRNPKLRPVLVITDPKEIQPEGTVVVACITTTIKDPIPPHIFIIPFDRKGHACTKLRSRSAVNAKWLHEVAYKDLQPPVGFIPDRKLLPILDYIHSRSGKELPEK